MKMLSPRGKKIRSFTKIPNKQKTSRSTFSNSEIEYLIKFEIPKARNDSEKMFIYQRAFEKMINKFHEYRPLLERIKQQYDKIGRDLLNQRREISMNENSESAAEDTYSSTINKIRASRNRELKEKKVRNEKLLDRLTELRLQRYELLEELDGLEKMEQELLECDSSNVIEINELTRKIQEMNEYIQSTESASKENQTKIMELKDEIDKTQQSTDELGVKDKIFLRKINELEEEEMHMYNEIERMKKEHSKVKVDLIALNAESNDLSNAIIEAKNKEEAVEKRYQEKIKKLRSLLNGTDINPNLPDHELIEEVSKLFGNM